jgi:hypothetical protein
VFRNYGNVYLHILVMAIPKVTVNEIRKTLMGLWKVISSAVCANAMAVRANKIALLNLSPDFS